MYVRESLVAGDARRNGGRGRWRRGGGEDDGSVMRANSTEGSGEARKPLRPTTRGREWDKEPARRCGRSRARGACEPARRPAREIEALYAPSVSPRAIRAARRPQRQGRCRALTGLSGDACRVTYDASACRRRLRLAASKFTGGWPREWGSNSAGLWPIGLFFWLCHFAAVRLCRQEGRRIILQSEHTLPALHASSALTLSKYAAASSSVLV